MSAKYMIMGALMECPLHGYDMKKRVFKNVFSDFGINDGQLYPLLKKLEQDGLIRKKVIQQEGVPNKHTYSLTPEGHWEFEQWLASSEGEERSFRYEFLRKDVFFIRCNYIRHLEKAKVLEKMERQIKTVENTIQDFRGARTKMIEKGVDPYRIKILEYGIKTQEARLQWLQGFLKAIQEDAAFHRKPGNARKDTVRTGIK